MADYLTLPDAKAHLRITDADHDAEIQTKLTYASGIVRDYLGTYGDPAWDATSAPDQVHAATAYMLGLLYEHRGDDLTTGAGDFDAATWDAVKRLLDRIRPPAFA